MQKSPSLFLSMIKARVKNVFTEVMCFYGSNDCNMTWFNESDEPLDH